MGGLERLVGLSMKIKLKFFASIREGIGHSDEIMETTAGTVGAVRDALIARGHPYDEVLSRQKLLRCAFEYTMVADDTPIHENGEVAFFPPVTGG
jgi:sulfur-carrier protein